MAFFVAHQGCGKEDEVEILLYGYGDQRVMIDVKVPAETTLKTGRYFQSVPEYARSKPIGSRLFKLCGEVAIQGYTGGRTKAVAKGEVSYVG